MIKSEPKSFDCVQAMRQIRDRISEEIEGMNHEEIINWFRSQRYSDPFLQRLAQKSAQPNTARGRAKSTRR